MGMLAIPQSGRGSPAKREGKGLAVGSPQSAKFGDCRLGTEDWGLETEDWRLEAGDWRPETAKPHNHKAKK
jgi:hypothetical protein